MKKVLFILGLFLISISSVFAQNELESTNSKSCNDFNFTKYNLSVEDTKYLVGLAKYYAKEDIDDIYDMVSFTMNLYESKPLSKLPKSSNCCLYEQYVEVKLLFWYSSELQ